MIGFQALLERAVIRHGGLEAVRARLPRIASTQALIARPDDRYLSDLVRRVFRAGMTHQVVDRRWPAFEQAFFGFDPEKLTLMPDHMLDQRLQDPALIRHAGKMYSIPGNARMVLELSRQHDGFGRFLAGWPDRDLIGLWALLRRRGEKLGGRSVPAFLRMVQRDTWVPTDDVARALQEAGVIEGPLTGVRNQRLAQQAMDHWQQESRWPYAHVSMVLAMGVGEIQQ